MKKTFLAALLMVTITGCHAQEKESKKDFATSQDTISQNKPQVNWKVNKRYDDNGNLVGYDSTYSWSYSNKGGVNHDINADSMLNAFRKHFDDDFPSFFGQHFGGHSWNDSLFYHDFTNPGELMQKWENDYFDMGKMMRRLDSLDNSLFNDNFPNVETEPKS